MSKITSAAKGQVISGPFRGLKYITYPKLFSWSMVLGTFEMELHSLLERLCPNVYDLIVNVGAAEDYYAVGMALRCPTAQVVAFDSDAECRALILQMARENSVTERVLVKGHCDITGLKRTLQGTSRRLIIMDIEGYEYTLLQPALITELQACEIVVELHEHIQPGLYDELVSRFVDTHNVQRIWQRERNIGDVPLRFSIFSIFLRRWLIQMMAEFRKCKKTSWLYMKPAGAV